jgi:hypothetical protein
MPWSRHHPPRVVDITPKSTVAYVGAFLEAKELGEFTALFKKCAVNGKRFLALTKEKLAEMGVDNAYARSVIMEEVEELKGLCLDVQACLRCDVSLALLPLCATIPVYNEQG